MKKIKLRPKGFALVDDDDYERLTKYAWYINNRGYVSAGEYKNGKRVQILSMHRMVNNTPKGLYTDHINHDKFDNRKSNLRTVTSHENQLNRAEPHPRNNKSGYRGVHWSKRGGKWEAQIKRNNIIKNLGYYDDLEEAVAVRRAAELAWTKRKDT